MQYTLFTPNKKHQYLGKNQVKSPQDLLSPEEKHEGKVKGLLEMIDSQFQSMHIYQNNFENQVNFRTEPDELFEEKQYKRQSKNLQSSEIQSKNALSNLLNLVDTNIIKSQKMNQLGRSKQNGKNESYQTPKTRRNTKTDQSVEIINDNQWYSQRKKNQTSNNTIIQNASVQTKPNKRKKLGFYTYEISYLSPSCKNCCSDKAECKKEKESQNESIRTQSNYVNAFKEVLKNESIMNKYFQNKPKKNEENQEHIKSKIDPSFIKTEPQKQVTQNFLSPDLISCNQNIFMKVKKQTQASNVQEIKILKPSQYQETQNPQRITKKLLAQPYLKIISKRKPPNI